LNNLQKRKAKSIISHRNKSICIKSKKYAPSISDAAAGIATATGFGTLAPGILLAGQNLAQLGSRLGNATENFSNRRNAITTQVNNLQNKSSGILPQVMSELKSKILIKV
jgi:hypothetical protein